MKKGVSGDRKYVRNWHIMQIFAVAAFVVIVAGELLRNWVVIVVGGALLVPALIFAAKVVCPECGRPCGGRLFSEPARYCWYCGARTYDFEASREQVPDLPPVDDTGWKFKDGK